MSTVDVAYSVRPGIQQARRNLSFDSTCSALLPSSPKRFNRPRQTLAYLTLGLFSLFAAGSYVWPFLSTVAPPAKLGNGVNLGVDTRVLMTHLSAGQSRRSSIEGRTAHSRVPGIRRSIRPPRISTEPHHRAPVNQDYGARPFPFAHDMLATLVNPGSVAEDISR
jgi:hypothetical protein